MNYPNPPYPPQQGYTQTQQPAQPAPAYFQQPQYQPQQFQPQPQQGYAPQPPAAAPPVSVRGTLEDFMNQPSGGGGAAITKFFKDKPQGTWIQLQVTRDILETDVIPQLDGNNQPTFFKTGGQIDYTRPKLVLVLKCTVLQSSDGTHVQHFQDGAAGVWIKGITRDAFVSAMGTAGIPNPAQALGRGQLGGAVFVMQSAGSRPSNRAGFSDTKLYNFSYTPGGRESVDFSAAQAPPAPVQSAPAVSAPPTTQPVFEQAAFQPPVSQPLDFSQLQQAPLPPTPQAPPTAPVAAPPGPAPLPTTYQVPVTGGVPAPAAAIPPVPTAAAVPPPAPAPGIGQQGMTPEMAQILARLEGQG